MQFTLSAHPAQVRPRRCRPEPVHSDASNVKTNIEAPFLLSWFSPDHVDVRTMGGRVTLTSIVENWAEPELPGNTDWDAQAMTFGSNDIRVD